MIAIAGIHYRNYTHYTFCIGVVLPFIRSLYRFHFLMILKETLTFLSLSNLIPQYLGWSFGVVFSYEQDAPKCVTDWRVMSIYLWIITVLIAYQESTGMTNF